MHIILVCFRSSLSLTLVHNSLIYNISVRTYRIHDRLYFLFLLEKKKSSLLALYIQYCMCWLWRVGVVKTSQTQRRHSPERGASSSFPRSSVHSLIGEHRFNASLQQRHTVVSPHSPNFPAAAVQFSSSMYKNKLKLNVNSLKKTAF